MKVVGATKDVVVIDFQRKIEDFSEKEIRQYANIPDNVIMFPHTLRVFKDRIELVVSLEQCGAPVSHRKKTLKIHFADAILMNRVLHMICGGKKPK